MVEVRRGLARRSTRLLVGLALALVVALGLGVFLSSRSDLDAESQRLEAITARSNYINDCVGSNGFGGEVGGRTIEELRNACESTTGSLDTYVDDKQFELTDLWKGNGRGGDG